MKYKTVAMASAIATNSKTTPDEAVAPVAKKIEAEAVGGWKFVNMYDMPITVTYGCIKSFFGKKPYTYYVYMLVFAKED